MNFQQLRSVRETVRQGFNLTGVAAVLHTSQPGVSRQIRELEDELGIELFHRAGKRLTGLTPPGEAVLPIVERLLLEADNLKRAGEDFASQDRGTLTIAATHSQARYALPPAVRDFSAGHPEVLLRLHQGSPKQVAEMLLDRRGRHRRGHRGAGRSMPSWWRCPATAGRMRSWCPRAMRWLRRRTRARR